MTWSSKIFFFNEGSCILMIPKILIKDALIFFNRNIFQSFYRWNTSHKILSSPPPYYSSTVNYDRHPNEILNVKVEKITYPSVTLQSSFRVSLDHSAIESRKEAKRFVMIEIHFLGIISIKAMFGKSETTRSIQDIWVFFTFPC